ncbi:SDR family oxidoreductase [Cohnella sp. WQ 127256]|uniref:SDR family oxidoreductase n=1 Tax=Cohnella sp. WQ 127256 TaxID=2938790 RepID=UPI0021180293|nr:SDR family oxidoreductase [Cohnella sp. WQ 127256]
MAKCLVTGGAGFIGSNLVEALLAANHEVRVLDNFSTGKRENLQEFGNRIELFEGDIRDLELCQMAATNMDYIFHQAAIGSVPRSVSSPLHSHENNVNGTLNILIAARDNHVKRIILASSSSAYGDSEVMPKVETMNVLPLSPYAVTKLVTEFYASVFHKVYGLETISLRYFNVFGPKQDPDSPYAAVIPKFIKSLLNNEGPVIHGDGEQSRDFTYIDNVVQANLRASEAPSDACGKVYNVACGDRISINELYDKLCLMLEKSVKPNYVEKRTGDVQNSLADIGLATTNLGYYPDVTVAQGLESSIKWYTQQLTRVASY